MNVNLEKNSPYRTKAILLLSSACCTLLLAGTAAVHGNNDLRENSPFVWEGYSPPQPRPPAPPPPPPPPGPNPLDNMELRGVTVLGGQVYFSLYNSETQRGFWLRPDEMEDGFSVVDFDQGMDSLTLQHGDRTRSITLKESKIVAMSSEQANRPPAGVPDLDNRRTEQAGQDRDQRLQQMAEQLRERREARRRALAGEESN
ncbi:MAG: hypothetical protein WD490_10475 [Opitutales bacterium]